MSPATRTAPLDTETAPLDTMSPVTFRVPDPVTEIAAPPAPPHPAWSSAATAGA